MSTRIPHGFRLKSHRVPEFILLANQMALANLARRLDEDIATPVPANTPGHDRILFARLESFVTKAKLAAVTQERKSLESGYLLFNYSDAHTYGWEYGPLAAEGYNIAQWVKEFAFYDNVERPAHISQRIWERRGIAWQKIALSHLLDGCAMTVKSISFAPGETRTESWIGFEYYLPRLRERIEGDGK